MKFNCKPSPLCKLQVPCPFRLPMHAYAYTWKGLPSIDERIFLPE